MASPKAETKGFVVNLRKILEDYAWKKHLRKIGMPLKLFARKNKFYFDMRWSYLKFDHKTNWTSFYSAENPNTAVKPPVNVRAISGPNPQSTPKDLGVPIVLHSAEYENRTPMEQKYTFSTQRETAASVSVEFQENYTLGASTNIELSLPGDVVSVSAGVNGELSVTETESQCFEDVHVWNVDTEITIKAGHKAKAFLSVHETEVTAEFEVITTMSLGKDWFPIMVRKRDTDEIVSTIFVTSLHDVYSGYQGPNLEVIETTDEENRVGYSVQLTSKGRFKSIGWTEQEVIVQSELLTDLSQISE
ncbi:uncharacterized protein LOC135473785 [Liolophura sinensis]|uniref:uncharacterized protein LOC135473785 n=1 Tax=Liolophura sinensis TaxID=3198878 RepID=UPI003159278A